MAKATPSARRAPPAPQGPPPAPGPPCWECAGYPPPRRPAWLRPLPGSAPAWLRPAPSEPRLSLAPPPDTSPSPLSPGLGCSRPQPRRAPSVLQSPPEMFDDGSTNRGVTPTPQGQYPRPPTPGLAVGAHLGEKSLCAGEQMAMEIRLGVLVQGVQPHRKFSPASTGSRAARPRPGPVSGESAGHCPFSFSGGIHPTPWLNPFWCLEPQSYPSSPSQRGPNGAPWFVSHERLPGRTGADRGFGGTESSCWSPPLKNHSNFAQKGVFI